MAVTELLKVGISGEWERVAVADRDSSVVKEVSRPQSTQRSTTAGILHDVMCSKLYMLL